MRLYWRYVAILTLSALLALLVYQLSTPVTSSWSPGCTASEPFVRALAARASADGYVLLALVDSAFVDMAANFHETSLRPNNIHNFLFVAVGRRTCELLLNASSLLPADACHHYADDAAADRPSNFLSVEFVRKMNVRTAMVLDALHAGLSILHSDTDVVFFRNPLPHLKELMLEADIATLWDQQWHGDGSAWDKQWHNVGSERDQQWHNAGFVVVRPTLYGRRVYELMRRETDANPSVDDQTALNRVIAHMRRRYQRQDFNALALNARRYACGADYFESPNPPFIAHWPPPLEASQPTKRAGGLMSIQRAADCDADHADACPSVLHNNWIVSREAKIYRFREHLLWMYDKDGYYSSETTRYMTYENTQRGWETEDTSITTQLNSLATALAIATMLDRVIILPRFHCFVNATTRWRLRLPSSHYDCPLNSLLSIAAFDDGFTARYRESSFLQHPKVPDSVRTSISKRYHVVTPTATNVELTEAKLKAMFGRDQHSVLTLASLEDVRPRYDVVDRQKRFDATVAASFNRSTYRQKS